jgi:hypothetical protein
LTKEDAAMVIATANRIANRDIGLESLDNFVSMLGSFDEDNVETVLLADENGIIKLYTALQSCLPWIQEQNMFSSDLGLQSLAKTVSSVADRFRQVVYMHNILQNKQKS